MYRLLAITLLLAACVPKKVHTQTMTVIQITPDYQIGRVSDTVFIIHASSYNEAKNIANAQLGCAKHPCLINTDGIILVVERPDAPKE